MIEELAEYGEPAIDRCNTRVFRADEEFAGIRVLEIDMAKGFEQAVTARLASYERDDFTVNEIAEVDA